jgi:hypothetical protein
MSALNTSTGSTAPNLQAPQARPNRPNQGNKKSKNKNGNKKNAPYISKLRSADPLPNDSDTTRIQARLASGGTALDIAEEAYRIIRINVTLRRDLAAAKAASAAPFETDADTARIKNRLDDNATAKEIAGEPYRVCRVNAHVKSNRNRAQAELRDARKKIAVKDDALSEMRKEYPQMRTVLQRTWGLLKSRDISVPDDLRKQYDSAMEPDAHFWQKKMVEKKKDEPKPKGKGKKKDEVKEPEKKEEKTTFLLHVESGRKYDLGKPLAEQDSDGGESEHESEPESAEPVARKNKRKGGDDIQEPVAKKRARMDDLEEGEIVE